MKVEGQKMRALVLLALVPLAGCTSGSGGLGDDGSGKHDVNPADRKILGAPEAFPADAPLRARQSELDGSMAARRAAAWTTLAKVLAPMALADKTVGGGD